MTRSQGAHILAQNCSINGLRWPWRRHRFDRARRSVVLAPYGFQDHVAALNGCRATASSSSAPPATLKERLARLSAIPHERVRNFGIIAHVDHGKSTLSDKVLQACDVIPKDSRQQFLDGLEVERERGITVKAQTCSMMFKSGRDGQEYLLNLIDTPGHVDFSYEVSRSLHACQGAVLLTDAVQGIQAQTVSTFNQAFHADLEVICALSKIDLVNARPQEVKTQLEGLCGVPVDEVLEVSGRTGEGVHSLLESIVTRVPPPVGNPEQPFKALLFDAYYESHRGVILLVAVKDGELRKGDKIFCSYSKRVHSVAELGMLHPVPRSMSHLRTGQVGYVAVGARDIRGFRVGETVWIEGAEKKGVPFPGFQPAHPMVYAGIFPEEVGDGEKLESAMQRLLLTDASVDATRDLSPVLGTGYRCGFLGLLHLDVFVQRLLGEYDVAVIATSPSVAYKIHLSNGEEKIIEAASEFPAAPQLPPTRVEEPLVLATIIVPQDLVPAVQQLCITRRGEEIAAEPLDNAGGNVLLKWQMPQAEVLTRFFNDLQAASHGYASFDYEPSGYKEVDLVRVNIRLNGDPVDALALLALRDQASDIAKKFLTRLADLIPQAQFDIGLQAVIGGKVIAKAKVKQIRKDVIAQKILAHGHSGDPNRKRALLDKQKEGKKRLREINKVQVPPEAFVAMVKLS